MSGRVRSQSVGVRFGIGTEYAQGVADERARILADLTALERDAAPLFFEGSPAARAVAAFVAKVREAIEAREGGAL